MLSEQSPPEKRYFWSSWFEGHSFGLLALVFALFSVVDLAATTVLLNHGIIREGNALALYVLERFDYPGFILMKLLLVLVVVGCCKLVAQHNVRLGHGVLWAGILVLAVVTLRHLAIIGVVLF